MLTVNHTASANGGSFSAGEGGLRMGYLSYEWASPEVFFHEAIRKQQSTTE